jgi:pyridoxal phosphate enzyme (YggS family)
MTAKLGTVGENLERVRERIDRACARAGRRSDEVTLVAVSKTFPAEAIIAAHDAGLRAFGENRVQEFESKQAKLAGLTDARWHLVGHLQSNKTRRAVNLFDRIDSVDGQPVALKIDSAGAEQGKTAQVLIEVHIAREISKSGVAENDLLAVAEACCAMVHVELLGLMAIPPYSDDPELARPYFRKLHELREDLRRRLDRPLPVLSMGMSHDFEVAIEEGATEIRVGTALFGGRSMLIPDAKSDH